VRVSELQNGFGDLGVCCRRILNEDLARDIININTTTL